MTTTTHSQQPQKREKHTWLRLLIFLLYIVLGLVAILNVLPYMGIVGLWLAEVIQGGFLSFLFQITGLQWILKHLLGICLWAVLQISEMIPMYLKMQQESYRKVGDDMLATAAVISAIAYVFDLLICLWYFPPLKGGTGALMMFATAGTLSDVAWDNVFMVAFTIWAMEFAIGLMLWVRKLIRRL